MTRTPVSLLKRLQSDPDDESWSRFVDVYAPMLYRWLTSYFRLQDQDAIDLVQEVLITLLRKMPTFRYDPKGSFRAWLFAVVSNHVKGFLRKQRKRPKPLDVADLEQKLEMMTDADSALGNLLAEEYDSRLLRRTLIFLKSEFEQNTWKAFVQLVLEDVKPADVARNLGMSINAVRIAKHRVLGRLRREIYGLME